MIDSLPDDNATELDRLRLALQSTQIGTWTLDIRQQQVWWDDRCKELYGFRKEDVVPYELVLSYVHDDDRERVNQAVLWALNPKSKGHYDVEFRTIGAEDGQLRWLHCQGQAHFDEQGQAYRFSGTAQNITEQKLASQSLQTAETKYQQLFNSLDEGFCTIRIKFDEQQRAVDYCFVDVNPTFEKQTGIVGAAGRWMRQIAPNHEQHWFDIYGQIAKTGQEQRFEAPADALGRYYDVFAFRVGGSAENLVGILFSDISKRKQAERLLQQSEARYRTLTRELEERVRQRTQELQLANQDLQRSNDNLQQFAYVASHDLQEPLRKIQSFGSLLMEQEIGQLSDAGQDHVQRIIDAGSRMSTLIKDLLTYSRISTRQQAFGALSLETVLDQVLSTLDWVVTERHAQIVIDPLPIVNGDKSQLNQLFQNLLSNAIKFTPTGQSPRIHVTCTQRKWDDLPVDIKPTSDATYFIQISVRDEGIGFDSKYLDRIFQVFQRLHSQKEYPGTGVGLAICQRVVENHGGGITASSQPGQGATFCVYLPA